ncbi:MAG: Clp1/GlmU family protein [Marinobacter sp.]|uniref:Clp1/GlmU family protein n=1 Tax=Marinobacter sp. TaxID=50741 RepID=UPI00299D0339|nr:Clp1/GlmU family protein [Marinobacter sp.]MDX1756091.1 Clp1/GlmU family protein [Marinobacter sp.]
MGTSVAANPAELVDRFCPDGQRILLLGDSGSGKSSLIAALMTELNRRGRDSLCLNCDPGLPGIGVPGTLSLGRFEGTRWNVLASQPLCTLDAGRFRLPLLMATRSLLEKVPPTGTLFVDSPGLTRGTGAAELIPALAELANVDLLLALVPNNEPLPVASTLRSLPVRIERLPPAAEARPITRSDRLQRRSQMWNGYLANSITVPLDPNTLNLTGTPPPLNRPDAWKGRQVALLKNNELQTLGEVVSAGPSGFRLRLAQPPDHPDQLLVRDAVNRGGRLRSLPKGKPSNAPEVPDNSGAVEVRVELGALTSVAREPQVAVRVGNVVATLVNGVMGDPLLQVRMVHHARSLLFDIGDTGRMPLRAAHQVSDLFLTHAHADHIGGFIWLVRSRIGHFPPCRVFGPPGLLNQVAGMMNGILWDRVEDRGPCFEVHEWHGDHLKRWRVTAGNRDIDTLATVPVADGVVLREPGFQVRATELDHGIPVLAYAYEPRCQINVRKDKLQELGLAPGPWLQDLKQAYLASDWQHRIALNDGSAPTVDELSQALLLTEPGEKLTYATDFGDSPDNVARLSQLAQEAHTLFCESSFLCADREQATRTHHLTTEACARIANQAQVNQLVAFHFSHRYEKKRDQVYRELQQFTDRLVVPRKEELS